MSVIRVIVAACAGLLAPVVLSALGFSLLGWEAVGAVVVIALLTYVLVAAGERAWRSAARARG